MIKGWVGYELFMSVQYTVLVVVDIYAGRYSEGVSSPHRHVKTRLYFTSESHIHSLLTVLRYGGLCSVSAYNSMY